MRRYVQGPARRLVIGLALALVMFAAGLLSHPPAASADNPPKTFGVVFVNGLGSDADQNMDALGAIDTSKTGNALRWYFNDIPGSKGYRTFMIGWAFPGPASASTEIDSGGDVVRNGKALGEFLAKLKTKYSITDVVLGSHSMGGIISREFIEHVYSKTDVRSPACGHTHHAGYAPLRVPPGLRGKGPYCSWAVLLRLARAAAQRGP